GLGILANGCLCRCRVPDNPVIVRLNHELVGGYSAQNSERRGRGLPVLGVLFATLSAIVAGLVWRLPARTSLTGNSRIAGRKLNLRADRESRQERAEQAT